MTLAWLIAGIVFYIPANLLPVMHTSGLLGEADSTILGGILEFWRSGDWDIALLIFIASVAVPFTKFIAIGLLLFTVRKNSRWEQHQRTVLYRIVEFIGYWSMLDVIVVALTSALMQFQVLGAAEPRAGIAFFCAVVVVTMLSALSFDPRLIWDRRSMSAAHHATFRRRASHAGGSEPTLDSAIGVGGADSRRRHRYFTAHQELGERRVRGSRSAS